MPSLYLYCLIYVISFVLVLSSDDWFIVWMGLEINMLSFIVMVYKRYDMKTMEVCFKYFFIQSVGSAVFIGMYYLYKTVLCDMMIMVLSYSIGAGPFYFWFPSLCSGLAWQSCYLLMSFQKMMPLMLISMFVSDLLWFVVIVGLFMGVFGSFNQLNIKQLLAYSSVHHLSWIMLCMLMNDLYWIMYLFMYFIMLLMVIYVPYVVKVVDVLMLSKFKGKWWFILSMFGMAGMPPFLGFFMKWMMFVFILNVSSLSLMFLVVASVLMFYVYMRMMYDMLMWSGEESVSVNYLLDKSVVVKIDCVGMLGMIMGLFMGLYVMF